MIKVSAFIILMIFIFPKEGFGNNRRIIELLTVSRGDSMGAGGHSAIRIDDDVYTFHPNTEIGKLVLSVRRFDKFRLDYNIVQERIITALRLDVNNEKINKIDNTFRFLVKVQQHGVSTYDYSILENNCVRPIREILNSELPEYYIGDDFFVKVPYFYMTQVEKKFPILEKKIYLSKNRTEKLNRHLLEEYFAPFSQKSPRPDSWRFFYTEDLRGPALIFRPIAGLSNMAVSALQMMIGIPTSILGRDDFKNGMTGFVKSIPELFFLPISMRRGYSIPNEILFFNDEDIPIFMKYVLPELDFLISINSDGNFEEAYQKPEFYAGYNKEFHRFDIEDYVYYDKGLVSRIEKRILNEELNDYYSNSLLKVMDLKDRHWIFNRQRTLSIESLETYLKTKNRPYDGRGAKVLVLEQNAASPETLPEAKGKISYMNFSQNGLTQKRNFHAVGAALLILNFAPKADVTIASYSRVAGEMRSAVQYAISEKYDIILHTEVHPTLSINSGFNPVEKNVKLAYDSGILWINSAGNFRESYFQKRFDYENEETTISFEVEKGEEVVFNFNFGDEFDFFEDEKYLFELLAPNGQKIYETQKRSFKITSLDAGKYTQKIKLMKKNENKKHNVLRVYSNRKLSPSMANDSSIASPANSKYAITIGASKNFKPVSYSSENCIIDGFEKPDFYAPENFKVPFFGKYSKTSAAASYAAAFFAILIGN